MLMKVFNKGQVVIPADIRRTLGIKPGDRVELTLDREREPVELRKPRQRESRALAGALSEYARKRSFPTQDDMSNALAKGLRRG
jgi:AbrB family looped-hinge helix DNA binding protein